MISIPSLVRISALRPGDVITRHPDHPHAHGEWTVTAQPTDVGGYHTRVDYHTPNGHDGVFVEPTSTWIHARRYR